MLRIATLLVVLALTGPSIVAAVCGVRCTSAAQRASQDEECHREPAAAGDTATLVGSAGCYHAVDAPALAVPASPHLIAGPPPAPVPAAWHAAEAAAAAATPTSSRDGPSHPPGSPTPLRI